jgi:hypothetical protein
MGMIGEAAMNEPIDTTNRKQKRQKPPRSLGRIVCEIAAGTATAATAAALAYSFFYVLGYGVKIAGLAEEGCMGSLPLFAIWGLMWLVVPPAYGLGGAVGVYFVGSRGNQTGSFPAILTSSLIGLFVMGLLYFYIRTAEMYLTLGIEKIILWPLVFLAVPIAATLGFNLTRRYKQPPSS